MAKQIDDLLIELDEELEKIAGEDELYKTIVDEIRSYSGTWDDFSSILQDFGGWAGHARKGEHGFTPDQVYELMRQHDELDLPELEYDEEGEGE